MESRMRRSNSIRPGGHSRNQSMGGTNNTTIDTGNETITSYLDETSGHLNDLVQSRTAIGDRDREIARLKDQLASVMTSRPPIEQMKALQKEYQNLELILQGTQRENERCMAELEKSKRRERFLEAELVKVYGDDWASHINFPTSSPSISRALPVSYTGNTTVRQSPPPQQQQQKSDQVNDTETNATALNEHIEAVRMLVLGMDAKLAERESQINKEMARAEEEAQKAASARKKIGV